MKQSNYKWKIQILSATKALAGTDISVAEANTQRVRKVRSKFKEYLRVARQMGHKHILNLIKWRWIEGIH